MNNQDETVESYVRYYAEAYQAHGESDGKPVFTKQMNEAMKNIHRLHKQQMLDVVGEDDGVFKWDDHSFYQNQLRAKQRQRIQELYGKDSVG